MTAGPIEISKFNGFSFIDLMGLNHADKILILSIGTNCSSNSSIPLVSVDPEGIALYM